MTPNEIFPSLDAVFSATVRNQAARYPLPVPAGVTAQAWEQKLDIPDEGVSAYLEAKAEGLAMVGLYYGCDTFARIRVVDRPPVSVKTAGGAVMRRPRVFIVRAMGWKA